MGRVIGGKSALMIVDDSRAVRRAMQDVLEHAGYAVVTARDGAEALERLRKAPVDAILLDMWMDGMDGPSFRRAQLADTALSTIPVIVMSATVEQQEALAMAADGWIEKPATLPDLFALIEAVIRRPVKT